LRHDTQIGQGHKAAFPQAQKQDKARYFGPGVVVRNICELNEDTLEIPRFENAEQAKVATQPLKDAIHALQQLLTRIQNETGQETPAPSGNPEATSITVPAPPPSNIDKGVIETASGAHPWGDGVLIRTSTCSSAEPGYWPIMASVQRDKTQLHITMAEYYDTLTAESILTLQRRRAQDHIPRSAPYSHLSSVDGWGAHQDRQRARWSRQRQHNTIGLRCIRSQHASRRCRRSGYLVAASAR